MAPFGDAQTENSVTSWAEARTLCLFMKYLLGSLYLIPLVGIGLKFAGC